MILATGENSRSRRAFTLIEVLLASALLAIVFTTALVLLPGAIGGPSGTAFRLDALIREAMVTALSEERASVIEVTEDGLLRLRTGNETLLEESFSPGLRLVAGQGESDLHQVLISKDGLHRDFSIMLGDGQSFFYQARMRGR